MKIRNAVERTLKMRVFPAMIINTFHATSLFLYSLKILENQSFLMFSGGIDTDQWHKMGYGKGRFCFFCEVYRQRRQELARRNTS